MRRLNRVAEPGSPECPASRRGFSRCPHMSRDMIDSPSVDETARRQFEEAWHHRRPQPIEHFLPPEDHPHYLATLEELVHIELEFAWKYRNQLVVEARDTLPQPSLVEAYQARFPQLNQAPILLRLLAQECL